MASRRTSKPQVFSSTPNSLYFHGQHIDSRRKTGEKHPLGAHNGDFPRVPARTCFVLGSALEAISRFFQEGSRGFGAQSLSSALGWVFLLALLAPRGSRAVGTQVPLQEPPTGTGPSSLPPALCQEVPGGSAASRGRMCRDQDSPDPGHSTERCSPEPHVAHRGASLGAELLHVASVTTDVW